MPKSAPASTLEVLPPARALRPIPTTSEAPPDAPLALVAAHHRAAQQHGALAVAHMILAGAELNRQQSALGYTRGRPSRAALVDADGRAYDTWEEAVDALAGVSKATAWRYQTLAKGLSKKVPAIGQALASASPDAFALVAGQVDGKTVASCFADWGISKRPLKSLPPADDPEPAAKRSKKEAAWLLVGAPIQDLAAAMANPDAFAKAFHHLDAGQLDLIVDTLSKALEAATLARKSRRL